MGTIYVKYLSNSRDTVVFPDVVWRTTGVTGVTGVTGMSVDWDVVGCLGTGCTSTYFHDLRT